MRKIILILAFVIVHFTFIIENCVGQWVQCFYTENAAVYAIKEKDNNIYIGTYGSNSGIYRSSNNGINWTKITPDTIGQIMDIGLKDSMIFAASQFGLYLSTNDGISWSYILNHNCLTIEFSNSNIFVGTKHGGIYSSSNNGLNWTNIAILNVTYVNDLLIQGSLFIAGTGEGIYRSTNSGINWVKTANQYIEKLTYSGSELFAGGLGFFKSTNNGLNWTPSGLNNIIIFGLYNYSGTLFSATHEGFYISKNAGNTWFVKNEGITGDTNFYSVYANSNFVFAGQYLHLFRRELNEIIVIKNISTEIPSAFSLEQNYPNPFNSVTKIQFKVASDKFVKLIVYDLKGREIKTLVNEELNPGTYDVQFDAGNLPSGVYFYRMEAGKFMETRKLILLK
ncbi:MAG: T9SS type A sorting domain-containing protein [Ignavibacteria bacterium]|nr:T9SS type A sorting domain-containing protein [Ignavibacteria bacterium]